jgi:hypothetical protein
VNSTGSGFSAVLPGDATVTQSKVHSTTIAHGKIAIFNDTRSNGTHGGGFNSGSWHARDINTALSDPSDIAVIESDTQTFSLNTGTFKIAAYAPAYGVDAHQLRLRQTTGTPATIAYGQVAYASAAGDTGSTAVLQVSEVSGAQSYQIQHQCQTTRGTFGRGVACSFGGVEVYTIVVIEKISP